MLVGNIWVPVVTEWLLIAKLSSALPRPASPPNTKETERNTSVFSWVLQIYHIYPLLYPAMLYRCSKKTKNPPPSPQKTPSKTKHWERDERRVLVANGTKSTFFLALPIAKMVWQGRWIKKQRRRKPRALTNQTTPHQTTPHQTKPISACWSWATTTILEDNSFQIQSITHVSIIDQRQLLLSETSRKD